MISCRAVTFEAVKLPARPLVDEFVAPLLLGLIEATSKATSTEVVIGACAESASQDIPESRTATWIVFISDKCRSSFCSIAHIMIVMSSYQTMIDEAFERRSEIAPANVEPG